MLQSSCFSSPSSSWKAKQQKCVSDGCWFVKPPFNKGSLTRLVAIVQSWSMFPWRQLISCIHSQAGLRSRGECVWARRGQPGVFPWKWKCFYYFFQRKVGQADVAAGAFRRAFAVIQITHICDTRNFLLIKEGSQVMAQDDGFTLGFVFELLNPILCVISKSTMCNYGNH